MIYIYALKLDKGKYYIGKTTNPQFRLETHFSSNGSEWTKLYKPIRILEIKPNCDDYDEDKITRLYMDKYGINNVRGGSFVSVKLERSTIDTLKMMSNGTNDNCFACGKSGHFAKNCPESECSESDSDAEYEYVYVCGYCEKEFAEEKKCAYHEKYCSSTSKKRRSYKSNDECFRCGREGHYVSDCYATKHVNGYYLKR